MVKKKGDRLRIGLTEYGQGVGCSLSRSACGRQKITVKTAMAGESTKRSRFARPGNRWVVEVNDELQFNPDDQPGSVR